MPIQDMNIHSANSIGGKNTSASSQTYSYGIPYLKSLLDAPIYWRNYNCKEHFYPALPIHPNIAL